MKKSTFRVLAWILCLGAFSIFLLAACSSLLTSFQQVDPQSATLTAMVTPTALIPTLDLKGNEVLIDEACEPYKVVCISILEDRPNGEIYGWADGANLLAYVAPENDYWAWFSGKAVVLDFSGDVLVPTKIQTSGVKVFGDFAFSPDRKQLAFVALRQSEKMYTVMTASLDSGLQNVTDLFPGSLAETDDYSSDKSVIEWMDNTHVRVSSSCGVDCEQIYLADITTGALTQEDETRKNGHSGRVVEDHVIDYETRNYPAMNQANWSPDNHYIFYTDNQDKAWILKDESKQQFELPLGGKTVLRTLWSSDSQYIAIRFEDNIQVYKVECK